MKFRTRQFIGFALVVAVMGSVTTWAGFAFLSKTVIKEAYLRVEMDLNSAWSAYREELAQLESAVSLSVQHLALRQRDRKASSLPALQHELEDSRSRYGLDFLTLVNVDRTVLARSRSAYRIGDTVPSDAVMENGILGKAGSGAIVVEADMLAREGVGLAELAYIPLVETERAVPRRQLVEDRGIVLKAVVPIFDSTGGVNCVLCGGILLNRKFEFVDRIRKAVFGDLTYDGRPVGTVTVFLWDVRVATNVMQLDRTRALGTRVSEEVYRTVLEGGRRFANRAFVVNDWYLSAYDPILDPSNKIIGILYVGLLEQKYLAYKSDLAAQFLAISFASLILAALVAFYLSRSLRRPIEQLVGATRQLSSGALSTRVHITRASQETHELATAFNSMAESLEKRSRELQQTTAKMEKAFLEADERNRAYLEMLGFVTHELKSPLASIVFAIQSVRDGYLGSITKEQEEVLKSAMSSADYLRNTIANYLNLGRIEEGVLRLEPKEAAFVTDIINPVVERLAETAADQGMRVICTVPIEERGVCDVELISTVFQNLLSNAVKYGRRGEPIEISFERGHTGVTFSIFNKGRGFSPQAAEKLFTKFFRWTAAEKDTRSGTGLGLFVTKRIVELHGGRISADSIEGQWARFSFTLPTRVTKS
jgi:two-component system NtrC family sensor kinase